MKKENNLFMILTIILVVAVLSSGITYFVMSNNNVDDKVSNQDQENEKTSDGVNFKSIEEKNDKIIEEFEVTLNGKTTIAKVEFTYDYIDNMNMHVINGMLNGTAVYYEEYVENKEESFNTDRIKNVFNTRNFDTIKGQDDKNYLIVYQLGQIESSLKVFNDNYTLLSKNLISSFSPEKEGFTIKYFWNNACGVEDESIWYPNTLGITFFNPPDNYTVVKDIHVKKEADRIYFLAPIINPDLTGTLEERVYTIKDDKLDYKVINTYKITEICNQAA